MYPYVYPYIYIYIYTYTVRWSSVLGHTEAGGRLGPGGLGGGAPENVPLCLWVKISISIRVRI